VRSVFRPDAVRRYVEANDAETGLAHLALGRLIALWALVALSAAAGVAVLLRLLPLVAA
jgi:hypothetical protein